MSADVDTGPSIELPCEAGNDLEGLLKDRMAQILPWAVGDDRDSYRTKEYGRLARALRQLLEQRPSERRVRLLDWPTDEGRLWMDLQVDGDPDYYKGCIAWKAEDGGNR